jgi:hypothetical protein
MAWLSSGLCILIPNILSEIIVVALGIALVITSKKLKASKWTLGKSIQGNYALIPC